MLFVGKLQNASGEPFDFAQT